MNWLEDFKIALIEEDEERLSSLISNLPRFEKREEMESAMRMIEQGRALFEEKKHRLAKEMKELEMSKKFFSSSDSSSPNHSLDITS